MKKNVNDYKTCNRRLWDVRVKSHLKSDFYNVAGFLKGAGSLNPIELELLGDVSGKDILHLQCHFGLDTLSLARLGARVTGVDISGAAIEQARHLAHQTALKAEFIKSDVYQAPEKIHKKFDVVFTTYGVLGWLPDMTRWAETVKHFLKPGGMLLLVEFHPVVWMFDSSFSKIDYAYFNRETIIEEEKGSYADPQKESAGIAVTWNHSLSDVLGALLGQGLNLTHFSEYDYTPYNCFRDMQETGAGQYQIRALTGKLPLLYALKAQNPPL